MDTDEQQLKPTNEIVKLVLNSSLKSTLTNPIEVEIQMPVHVEKVYMYEAETQTSDGSDLLSREAGDEARLTGSNKYALLSLDEYQIIRTGEEHCLKKYFSDDDVSFSDDEEEISLDKQLQQIQLEDKEDEEEDRTGEMERIIEHVFSCIRYTGLRENVNNNASIHLLHPSSSNLSNTLLFDDTTQLTATLAVSTSSKISHSRYLPTFEEEFQPLIPIESMGNDIHLPSIKHEEEKKKKNISSIRCFVRQAIDTCRQNLTMVDQLLEHLPSSYGHILQRKIHRTNCIVNIPNSIKGLQYSPSMSVQTE